MARLFRSKRTTIWLVIAGLVVLLLAAGGGSYVAVNAGGSPAPTPTVQPTNTASPTATPSATLSPTATAQPTATATDTPPPPATATSAPPPATATSEPAPKPTRTLGPVNPPLRCPNRGHNHLNIERLREQPGLADAEITEVDSSTIRIRIEGVEFLITGWDDDIGIGGSGEASDELFHTVVSAVDAVAHEC